MILRFIYTLFIGVLFAILVGVGIAAFYSSPEEPEYPSALKIERPGSLTQEVYLELKAQQEAYDKAIKIYQEQRSFYNRNVSVISIIFAIITLVISLTLFKSLLIISDGLLLGGVLTLVYAIIVGFGGGNDKFRFIVVTIGFIVSVVLGFIKFIAKGGQSHEMSKM